MTPEPSFGDGIWHFQCPACARVKSYYAPPAGPSKPGCTYGHVAPIEMRRVYVVYGLIDDLHNAELAAVRAALSLCQSEYWGAKKQLRKEREELALYDTTLANLQTPSLGGK